MQFLFVILAGAGLALAFSRIARLDREVRRLRNELSTLRTRLELRGPSPSKESGEDHPAEDAAPPQKLPAHLTRAPTTYGQDYEQPKSQPVDAKPPSDDSASTKPPPPPPISRAPEYIEPPTPRPPLAESTPSEDELPRKEPAGFLSKIGPQDPDMTWEAALGTYWLPRIGALFLSVGAVLLLTLALQSLGPGFRVTLGYAVAIGFLGFAWWLERSVSGFARVLYGLGFGLLYLVTFGTYYFPPARVFETPVITLTLLGLIIAAWIALAQVRRSPTVALTAIVLGHFTIGLASFTLDEPGIYSVAGIFLLSLGGAFFLLRDRWYYIAAVGMLGSYFNHFLLMTQSESSGLVSEFTLGMSVLSGYFLIYALAELFAPEQLRRHMPNAVRSLFVTVNTACFFALGSVVVHGYDFSQDHQHTFRYLLAAALFALGLLYLRVRGRDPIYNAYLTKGSAALTLGLAAQFDGAVLTCWLAVQTVTLLFSSRRSGLIVTRVLAFLVAGIAFLHGIGTAIDIGHLAYDDPDYTATLFQFGLTVVGFLFAVQLYERTDWTQRALVAGGFTPGAQAFLWRLDLAAAPPQDAPALRRPLNGLLFPHAYALAGALLFIAFTFNLADFGHRFTVFGIFVLASATAGRLLGSQPIATLALVGNLAAVAVGTHEIIDAETEWTRFLPGMIPLLASAFFIEPRLAGTSTALKPLQHPASAIYLHGTAAWLLFMFFTQHYDAPNQLFAVAATAIYYAALHFIVSPPVTAWLAGILLLTAHLLWYPYATGEPTAAFQIATLSLLALAIAGDRLFAQRRVPGIGHALIVSLAALLLRYLHLEIPLPWVPVAWSLAAAALAAYALGLRTASAAVSAVVAGVLAAILQVVNAYDQALELAPLIAGFLAPTALWIAGERIAHRYTGRADATLLNAAAALFTTATTLLLVCLLERIPALAQFYLTIGWSALGFTLFGLALITTQKFYRYAGLAVLLLASLRVILVDTRELEAIPKILAWAVLGTVLIVLGYGYVKAFASSADPKDDIT